MKKTKTSQSDSEIRAFTTEAQVRNTQMGDLVRYYNAHTTGKPVTKFTDRATAERRVIALLPNVDLPLPASKKQVKPKGIQLTEALKAKDTKKPKVQKCANCGRSTINSDTDAKASGLCSYCYEADGLENALADGRMTQEAFDEALVQLKAAHRRTAKLSDSARVSLSTAVAETWKDAEVRAARCERSAVVVDGVQFKSVADAFRQLHLPMGQHIRFRGQLKEQIKMTAYDKKWEVIPLNY
jgi:hypothetical protein